MLARREFFRAAAYTREKGVFVAIDADDFPPSRRGAATFSAQLHLPTHIASRYDPSGDASRSRRRRGTGPRRVQSRVSGAPALAIAFFVSVARREASSTNPPSRRPATDPRPPLRLHRTLRRWLPRTVPLSSSPPSLSTRVTPTSSRTRCVIARLSIRALSFNADRRFFARRDRENEPRRRRSVASTAIIATCFGRSADETSSPHHPTDLRRCPRCLPRPGSRLQGASPAA